MSQRGNRFDSIRAHALDAAVLLGAESEEHRNAVADALIKLCGEIVDGAAKHLAIKGEIDLNEAHKYGEESPGDKVSAHTRYLAGEALQTGAQETVKESLDADLDRYESSGLPPVWTPPEVPSRPLAPVLPLGRVAAGRRGLTLAANLAADMVARTAPAATAWPGPVRQPHVWQTRDGGQRCALCGDGGCEWLPGDATPACDHDADCPVHGDRIARECGGRREQQPTVAPDAVRRSVHGNTSAEDVAAGRCPCATCNERRRNGR